MEALVAKQVKQPTSLVLSFREPYIIRACDSVTGMCFNSSNSRCCICVYRGQHSVYWFIEGFCKTFSCSHCVQLFYFYVCKSKCKLFLVFFPGICGNRNKPAVFFLMPDPSRVHPLSGAVITRTFSKNDWLMDGQSKILRANNLFLIAFFLSFMSCSDGTQHKSSASLTDLIYALVHVP